jgi:hypothetical protein
MSAIARTSPRQSPALAIQSDLNRCWFWDAKGEVLGHFLACEGGIDAAYIVGPVLSIALAKVGRTSRGLRCELSYVVVVWIGCNEQVVVNGATSASYDSTGGSGKKRKGSHHSWR